MKKVAFYTLGCKLNFSETSGIARSFEEKGYKRVDFHDTPDIFVINTCSVTENADKKCRKIAKEARRISPEGFVAIIGCYAQLKPREISEIPEVDAVLGASEKFRILDLLGTFKRENTTQVYASDIKEATKFNLSYSSNDRTRTFLKVQDGCNYNCAFCTIPLARGKSRSESIEVITREARSIADSGVREIVLTGVNTGDFGIRNDRRVERFIDLIKSLDKIENLDRIRISSIEPNLLTDDIISFVAESERIVPHLHVPLQSGSDKLLKRMYRRYSKSEYESRIMSIHQQMPHAAIGVDVIVGFPGETWEDFLETYDFINSLPVAYLHVFTYSERANTAAIEMDGVVPLNERRKRSKMLRILSEKKKRAFYEGFLGEQSPVLFEEDVENGRIHGFTDNYLRVSVPYDPALVNEIVPVSLDHLDPALVIHGELVPDYITV